MPYTPPWLAPLDWIAAMRGGAEAGLGAARISQVAREAADRTRLGYAQLAGNQSSDLARIAASREASANALAARQAESAAEEAQRLRAHNLLERRLAGDLSKDEFDQQLSTRAQELLERKQTFEEGKPLATPRLPQEESMLLGDALTTKRAAQLALADPNKAAYAPARNQLNEMIINADSVIRGLSGQDVAPTAGKLPAVPGVPGQPAYHREMFGLEIPGTSRAAIPGTPDIPERFAPPADTLQFGLPTQSALPEPSVKTKVEMANEIAKEHPTWTKKQVLEELNKRMP